jgi:hypothetical protein
MKWEEELGKTKNEVDRYSRAGRLTGFSKTESRKREYKRQKTSTFRRKLQ